jgi:hypothetical protein
MSTDDLLAEALRLPRRERAKVAQELLSSLEEPPTMWPPPGPTNYSDGRENWPTAAFKRCRGRRLALRF